MKSDVLMTPDEFLDACFGIHHCSPPASDARHVRIACDASTESQTVECRCTQAARPCKGCPNGPMPSTSHCVPTKKVR